MLKNYKPAGQKLYTRAKSLIPGGTQLLSKRPELFAPNIWPAYYSKAKGPNLWDLDNIKYLDMSIMAVGACILGYADDDVDQAVIESIRSGVNSSLNCPEEVELADILIGLHPWFDMVRYSRGGGEAVAIAVRIARAKTKREIILFSGYHGWSDWYLASNIADDENLDGQLMPGLAPNGVPRGLSGTSIPFNFNELDSLKQLIAGKENQIAAIMIEPARGNEAPLESLQKLKNIAKEIGAVLIYDEITSGFRGCVGGIHRKYKVYPDMAIFAKSMANGYAMSAILGTEDVMQAAQSTFISSTNWTERVGPSAALATIKKYQETKTDEHIISIGQEVQKIWKSTAIKHNLEVEVTGLPSLAAFSFKGDHSVELSTKFVIEMLEHNILGFRQFKASLSHSKDDIKTYAVAVDKVFNNLKNLSDDKFLEFEKAHTGFSRLTKE
jgi:glutamate-1-semialdehyde aminotransferase